MNQVVNVGYDSSLESLLCTFKSAKTGQESCNITYGLCGKPLTQHAQGSPTSDSNELRIPLKVEEMYCYIVTASNGTSTVFVMGSLSKLLSLLIYCYLSQYCCRCSRSCQHCSSCFSYNYYCNYSSSYNNSYYHSWIM